jgi:PAS domain S-box-containing protein
MASEKNQVDKIAQLSQIIKENSRLIDSLTKSLIDTSPKILLVLLEGNIVYANPKAIRVLGYSLKELSNVDLDELFVSTPTKSIKSQLSKIVNFKRRNQQIEVTLHSKGGSIKWFSPNIARCYWKGKPSLLLSLDESNTVKNPTDIAGRATLLYRSALKVTGQAIWQYDFTTGESYVSEEFFEALGYKGLQNEPTVDTWKGLLNHESLEEFTRHLHAVPQTKKFPLSWEYRANDSSGHTNWFLSTVKVTDWDMNGTPIRALGIHTNITEQKLKDASKDDSVILLKGIISKSKDGIVVFNDKGTVIEWNQPVEALTNIKRAQAVGQHIGEIEFQIARSLPAGTNQLIGAKEIFSSSIFSGKNPFEGKTIETSISLPNGNKKNIEKTIAAIQTHKNILICVTIKDVTEAFGVLRKFEKNEERLKLAMAAGKVGVWDIDLITGERYFSPMAFNVLGYLPWEVEPSNELLKEIIHPDDLEYFENKIRPFLISEPSVGFEIRLRKKDGTYAWILSKNKILRDNFGKALRLTGTITDITTQKNIEMELRQSQGVLEKNIQQQELLAQISYIFNTNQTLYIKNQEVIEMLGAFTHASRVYIFENNNSTLTTCNTHEWCKEGIAPQIGNLQEVPLELIDEWTRGKEFFTSNNLAADLPSPFSNMMIAQGIQSFLIFPIKSIETVYGFIGFDECEYPRVWRKSEIELLKTIANIISFAFERAEILDSYKLNELRYRELSQNLPQILFEVSSEGQVLFINEHGLKFFDLPSNKLAKGLYLNQILPLREILKIRAAAQKFQGSTAPQPISLTVKTLKHRFASLNIIFVQKSNENGRISYSVVAFPLSSS